MYTKNSQSNPQALHVATREDVYIELGIEQPDSTLCYTLVNFYESFSNIKCKHCARCVELTCAVWYFMLAVVVSLGDHVKLGGLLQNYTDTVNNNERTTCQQ